MQFKDLAIGDEFDFVSDHPDDITRNSFYETCTKTSTRKYRWRNPVRCTLSPSEFLETRVGSESVEVYHVVRGNGCVCQNCGGQ